MSEKDSQVDKGFMIAGAVTIALAHFFHDIFTALIAPLLPVIIEKLSLSLFLAGSLSVLPQIAPLFNPYLGSLVDRGGFSRLLVIVSPFITCTTICLIGLAPNYPVLAVLLLISGMSVAAIHLAAPVIMAELSGNRVGRGMSFFMVGGESARMAGPGFAVLSVSVLGFEGLWKLIPLGALASLILWWRIGRIEPVKRGTEPLRLVGVWKKMGRTIIAVMGIMVARAFMQSAVTTFMPTFRYSEGSTLLWANAALFLVEVGGTLGVFASGTLSDWVGRRKVLLFAVVASPPSMLLFLAADGPATWAILLLLGFVTISTTPVLWAVMLDSGGVNRATASGTFTMISFSIRSLVILLVGALGDSFGLRTAYYMCAFIAFIGIPFVFLLPRDRHRNE